MVNDLPDDTDVQDDEPVKVAYHKAPEPFEPEEDILDKEDESTEPDLEPEEDPLDDTEDPDASDPDPDPDPVDDDPPSDDSSERTFSKNLSDDMSDKKDEYYLQAVKAGEQPEWPREKEELDVFSKPIDSGLIQYWAYPKDAHKTEDSMPNAEAVAMKNKSDNPIIIIDQTKDHLTPGCCLELILAKDGHALAKTDSNLDNLEANVTTLIDTAKVNFNIGVEHFISTSNVSAEVEKRLDDLEEAEDGKEKEESNFQQASVYNPQSDSDQPILPPKSDGSKWAVLIPVVLVVAVGVGIIFYRDKLLSIVNPPKQEAAVTPTPILTPTPTPTVAVDRSQYKIRVLNGTPTTGAAGTLAEKLKAKGWNIEKTGNATSSAVAQSYIRGKTGIDEVLKTLMDDVSDYQASISAVILPASDKADAEFVIGKK